MRYTENKEKPSSSDSEEDGITMTTLLETKKDEGQESEENKQDIVSMAALLDTTKLEISPEENKNKNIRTEPGARGFDTKWL